MYNTILLSATEQKISQLTWWALLLINGLLILRLMRDLYAAYEDPEVGLKEALKKGKKRIAACIIAITVSGLVAWIQQFY